MRTIQEKYNAILEGKFSKTQFVRDARMELPNLITKLNGFNDTVTILKNRRILNESLDKYSNDALSDMIVNMSRYEGNEPEIADIKKELERRRKSKGEELSEAKEEIPQYDKPEPGYSIEALERAVDYELEAMGLMSQETITQEQYDKARGKAEKNLQKNPTHYLDLLAGESKKVDKHDKYVEVKKDNHVDTFNGMKKAELKEGVVEKAMGKGYTKEQVEAALTRLKEKKGKDLDGDGDIDSDDYLAARDSAIKANIAEGRKRKMKGGKVVTESDYETGGYVEAMGPRLEKALKHLIQTWDEWKQGPMTEPGMVPHAKTDLVKYITSQLTEQEDDDFTIAAVPDDEDLLPKESKQLSKDQEGEDIVEDYKPSLRAYNVIDGEGNIVYKELPRHTAIEKASEREDYKFSATDRLAEDYKPSLRAYNVIDGEGNIIYKELPRHTAIEKASEREDYGFVATDSLAEDSNEGVNEQFFDDIEAAKDYARKESEQGFVQHVNKHPKGGYRVEDWLDGSSTVASYQGGEYLQENKTNHKQLQEVMKNIIKNVLAEQVVTEAATGNLSTLADKYDDYEGMQPAVNSLENIVTDIESYYSKTRDKIQGIFNGLDSIKNPDGLAVGAFLAPTLKSKFLKDLQPVQDKGFTNGITLPKVNTVDPAQIQEKDELEEKQTIFKPVNEGRKSKYTKRHK